MRGVRVKSNVIHHLRIPGSDCISPDSLVQFRHSDRSLLLEEATMNDEIEYLDFEITVQKSGESEYIIRAESGDGEAEARFTSPFNQDKRALIDDTLTKVA